MQGWEAARRLPRTRMKGEKTLERFVAHEGRISLTPLGDFSSRGRKTLFVCFPWNEGRFVKRVVDKWFVVRAPLEVAWNHVAEVENWPTWARHIRSVRKVPPGPLSSSSRGTLRLANGIATRFEMIEFERLEHWKWASRFFGSQILYDHIFSQLQPEQTTIRFTVDITGALGVLIGGIFGRIYRKNLERAVPLLVRQIEAGATQGV